MKMRRSIDGLIVSGVQRNFLVDVMRGIALLVVMMIHGASPIPDLIRSTPFLIHIASNGVFGVDVFFVISGFVITVNTLRRYGSVAAISVRSFYVMRIARIFPCLALFSLAFLAFNKAGVVAFVPDNPVEVYRGIESLFTLHFNYFYFTEGNVRGLYPMAPLWSIAVEETFYLLFPIACFLCLKDRVAWLVGALLLIVGPSLRDGFNETLTLPGVVDLLAAGCLTAQGVNALRDRRLPRYAAPAMACISAAMLLTTMSMASPREGLRWSLSLIGLFTSVYLFAASKVTCSTFVRIILSPLAFIGRMSLQVYVFHMMVLHLGQPAGLPVWATFVITLVLAWMLEWSFLEPCNRYIRRLYAPSRTANVVLPQDTAARPIARPSPAL